MIFCRSTVVTTIFKNRVAYIYKGDEIVRTFFTKYNIGFKVGKIKKKKKHFSFQIKKNKKNKKKR